MERRDFLQTGLLAGAAAPFQDMSSLEQEEGPTEDQIQDLFGEDVTVEEHQEGAPHEGKVLAAIQPHSDDIPLFAAGTVAKLIDEGYEGYLIRTSNDDHAGSGETVGEVIRNNEKDNEKVADVLGLEDTYDLYNRNHRMDEIGIQELKARLIFLFRLLEVDTIVCYDPWAHHEENPDHYITAKAVEAARWMAGGDMDYPEHFAAGLEPHYVSERYYFGRFPRRNAQYVNRIVDISQVIDTKVKSNRVNVTQGPAGEAGARLRRQLAKEGKKLPLLGEDDETANMNYIKHILLDIDSLRLRGVLSDKKIGEAYGVGWGEAMHYMGPSETPSQLEKYIAENAVST
jgi:LmbE family N-acetylglucosaminyl deacetylase